MVSLVSSPSSSTSVCHVRSLSLPTILHPKTLQVEDEIAHLRTCEASCSSMPTVDTVESSILRLERLYTSVNDLLSLPLTQHALLRRKDGKLVDELLDWSMRLLDVCGSIKDVLEQAKEHIRNVQSAIRRKKEGLNINAFSLGKMKDAKKIILALKQIDNKIGDIALLDIDHHLLSVIRSLKDTTALSVSIFGSLLSVRSIFMSKSKSSKWSVVSSLIHKGKKETADKHQISNEAALESHIEVIENSLECMFRTLIKTRVSLLNIRSQ